MSELWLTYTDADGSRRRIAAVRAETVIGRHSECDIAIADSRLSRRHARILHAGGKFLLEDLGSSNGTDLNGEPLFEPAELKNGDRVSFGGLNAEIEVAEVVAASPSATAASPISTQQKAAPERQVEIEEDSGAGGGIPIWAIFMAPVIAAVLVVVVGAAVFVVMRGSTDVSANEIEEDPPILTDDPKQKKDKDEPTGDTGPTNNSPTNNSTSGPNAGPTPTPANLSETAKVEINAASFLRKIAQNGDKAFLTGEQAKRVSAKVKQIGASSALAENINSARKNGAQIKSLAAAKNLKPQMLAVAAITKLGGARGDVMAAATSMADVLDKLTIQLGNEFPDDCLLTMAAYDQGVAGDTMKLRNMLQDLSTKSNETARTIRTIWFLQKEGKITPAQFEFALHFLAAGTIAQNPKEFGVNAEALDI